MTTELDWLVSTSASALGAAEVIAAGKQLVDRQLNAALEGPTRELVSVLEALGVPAEPFFAQLAPASSRYDTPRALAQAVVARHLSPAAAADASAALADKIGAVERAFALAAPEALAELELRGGPLREQWEARGPGLLAAIARLTEPGLLVETATVVLVKPVRGGGGAAHPAYNAVSLEAVLANPYAELPEIVRLGWLLAQLTYDMPRFADALSRDVMAKIGPLAMIPPALAAAQEVELARFDPATLASALSHWAPLWNAGATVEPQLLLDWWQTYQASPSDWVVALGALAEMIGAEPR